METFKLNFCHPVKGSAKFVCSSDRKLRKTIPLDTDNDNLVEIPLNEFPKGKWHVVLEWEADGGKFLREEDINI
jgi:hypothetical protein